MGVDVHGFYTEINVWRGPAGRTSLAVLTNYIPWNVFCCFKSISCTESDTTLFHYREVLFDCNDVESLVNFFFYWSLSICAMAPFKLGLISCVNASSPCGTTPTAVSLAAPWAPVSAETFQNYFVDIRADFSPPSTHGAKINPSSGPFKIFSSHPCFQFHWLNHFGHGNKPLPSNWLCTDSL